MIFPLTVLWYGDFFAQVIIAMPDMPTIGEIADQYAGWVVGIRLPARDGGYEILNEAGEPLDPAQTCEEAGLGYGDIIRIKQLGNVVAA